jgi:hypothetical protein
MKDGERGVSFRLLYDPLSIRWDSVSLGNYLSNILPSISRPCFHMFPYITRINSAELGSYGSFITDSQPSSFWLVIFLATGK